MNYAPRRSSFISGQLLSAEDLQTEQDYHRSMRYLQNRMHGDGVVQGLDVEVGVESELRVSPGIAIDALGRELVMVDTQCLRADTVERDQLYDVVLLWGQQPARTVPDPEGQEVITQWLEQPKGQLVPSGQGPPGAVLLARVRSDSECNWSVDPSVCRRHPLADQVVIDVAEPLPSASPEPPAGAD